MVANGERTPRAEPERCLNFRGVVKLEESGSEFSSKQNTMSSFASPNHATEGVAYPLQERTKRRRHCHFHFIRAAVLQLVRDVVPNVRNPFHGLCKNLCFPDLMPLIHERHQNAFLRLPGQLWSRCKPPGMSLCVCTRVVLLQTLADGFHPQRDDNVALFRMPRDYPECVNASTLDTRSMWIIRLPDP